MRSLRQYVNVMFDTLALCERTECRMADRSSAGFLKFQLDVGKSGELATGQETLPIRVLASARFFSFPFCFKKPNLFRAGIHKTPHVKRQSLLSRFEGANVLLGLTLRRER